MPSPVLITIRFSHYCEKARWALERAGLAFREDGHAPLFHYVSSMRRAGNRSVPVLLADGQVLRDSTDILRWAHDRGADLLPAGPEQRAEVDALEDDFDRHLGPAVRRIMYDIVLRDRALALSVMRPGIPRWEQGVAPVLFRPASAMLRRGLRIDRAGVERSLAVLDRTLAELDARLAGQPQGLVGDRFTAADLTFAALLAPALDPPNHPAPIPRDLLPPDGQALVDRVRATNAGRFALRLYEQERPRVASNPVRGGAVHPPETPPTACPPRARG